MNSFNTTLYDLINHPPPPLDNANRGQVCLFNAREEQRNCEKCAMVYPLIEQRCCLLKCLLIKCYLK